MQADAGFLEGVVRGYKNALLTQSNYNNLTQCETLEGAPLPLSCACEAPTSLGRAASLATPLLTRS